MLKRVIDQNNVKILIDPCPSLIGLFLVIFMTASVEVNESVSILTEHVGIWSRMSRFWMGELT